MSRLAFTKELPQALNELARRFPKLIRPDDISLTPEAKRDLSNMQYGKIKSFFRRSHVPR